MSEQELSARARVRIRRPPAEVFEAFTDPTSMSQFWFTRRDRGLKAGSPARWSLGQGEEAFAFDVHVEEVVFPNRIVLSWERDGAFSRVTWTLQETGDGDTILTIEETGFQGSRDSVIAQALDSTGGFNQVVIAAKAYVEHGVALNVVADHA